MSIRGAINGPINKLMSTMYVTEYAGLGTSQFGPSQAPQEPPLAAYNISLSGISTTGQAFNTKTALVRLHTDAICSYAIGASPVAVTTANRMAANQTEYKAVQQGAGHSVAGITNV